MTWDTTDLADYNDIIVQDGVFAYNYTASGTIYKGQAVALVPGMDNTVMVCTSDAGVCDSIGLATMGATNGKQISIAGPGNICWACVDAAEAVNTPLYGDTDGVYDAAPGNATRVSAIIVSLPALVTTAYVGKVLVL